MFLTRLIPHMRKGTAMTSLHQRFHAGTGSNPSTLIRPAGGALEGLVHQGAGAVGDDGQLDQAGHRTGGDDQGRPARPAVEAPFDAR